MNKKKILMGIFIFIILTDCDKKGNIEIDDIEKKEKFIFKTVTSKTGRVWMDRNMGAKKVAIKYDDSEAYGDYYQKGRAKDGHQKRESPTTTTLATDAKTGHNKFIIDAIDSKHNKWHAENKEHTFWIGSGGHSNGGINNPCPIGFRVPTIKEWEDEIATWDSSITDVRERAFSSRLKLCIAGYRNPHNNKKNNKAPIEDEGENSYYWSSSNSTDYLFIDKDGVYKDNYIPSRGHSVRCIKN